MKKNKLKIIAIILFILLLTMIAFVGVYTKKDFSIENAVKNYQYDMELSGKRVVTLEVDNTVNTVVKDAQGKEVSESVSDEDIAKNGYTKEEVPVNKSEEKKYDNYILSKEVIESRLKSLNVPSYVVRVDDATGKLVIELPENSNTDNWIDNIQEIGTFEITDEKTGEVLLNNDDIKLSQTLKSSTSSGTQIYFSIEFKDKAKLEEITRKYVPAQEEEKTEESSENANNAENAENTENSEQTTNTEAQDLKISMKYNDVEVMSTSFDEPITDGKLYLTVGQASTDIDTLRSNLEQARNIASILSNKKLPLKYSLKGNQYINSTQKDTITESISSYVALVVVVATAILVGKYKLKGLLVSTANIGFAALLLIIIRYWNVVLSTEGVAAVLFVLILNFILLNKMLNKITKKEENAEIGKTINSSLINFAFKLIPVFIVAIVLAFATMASTSSFGMVMFWGITLIELYNLTITKNLLK